MRGRKEREEKERKERDEGERKGERRERIDRREDRYFKGVKLYYIDVFFALELATVANVT